MWVMQIIKVMCGSVSEELESKMQFSPLRLLAIRRFRNARVVRLRGTFANIKYSSVFIG